MKRPIARRAALARLRRKFEASGLGVWKATKREVDRFGLRPGDYVVTSREGIVETGALERLCRVHGVSAPHEAIEPEAGTKRGRDASRAVRSRREGTDPGEQGSLPF